MNTKAESAMTLAAVVASLGTALGVASVQRLTERMGGALTLARAPGAGAVFSLSLPAAPAPGLASSRVSGARRVARLPPFAWHGDSRVVWRPRAPRR